MMMHKVAGLPYAKRQKISDAASKGTGSGRRSQRSTRKDYFALSEGKPQSGRKRFIDTHDNTNKVTAAAAKAYAAGEDLQEELTFNQVMAALHDDNDHGTPPQLEARASVRIVEQFFHTIDSSGDNAASPPSTPKQSQSRGEDEGGFGSGGSNVSTPKTSPPPHLYPFSFAQQTTLSSPSTRTAFLSSPAPLASTSPASPTVGVNGGGTGTTGAGAGVDDDGGRSTVAAKDVAATADTTPTPSFKVGSAPLALEPDPMEEPMERSMQLPAPIATPGRLSFTANYRRDSAAGSVPAPAPAPAPVVPAPAPGEAA